MSGPGLLVFVPTIEDAQAETRRYTDGLVISSETGPLGLRKAIIHLDMGGTVVSTAGAGFDWRAPLGTRLLIDERLPEGVQERARAVVPVARQGGL